MSEHRLHPFGGQTIHKFWYLLVCREPAKSTLSGPSRVRGGAHAVRHGRGKGYYFAQLHPLLCRRAQLHDEAHAESRRAQG